VFYLDEQMSNRVANLLRRFSIDATTVDWLGHKGLSDAVQLLHATRLRRSIVTYNVNDFMLLQDAWLAWSDAWPVAEPQYHEGILAIRSTANRSDEDLARVILELITGVGHRTNRMFCWDARQGWREYRDRTLHPLIPTPDPG
jgi:hypothetical protein